MSYIDMYKSRLNASGGNLGESIINSTKQTVKNNFNLSPFSESVLIDDVEFKAVITQGDKSKNKTLLLQPDTVIAIGSNVKVSNNNYLVMDFRGEGINEVYPTASLEICNSFFPAITDKTRVLKRDANGQVVKDKFGDPVYIWTGGEIFNVPCIVESSIKDKESNNQLNLPDGRLKVSMKYQPIANVKLNETFKMYDNTYKITHIDLTQVINSVGIMVVTADIVPSEVIS